MKQKNIIKSRRLALGLTQLDVAKAVGVSEGTISRWESGNIANVGSTRLESLSKVLKINPAELVLEDYVSPAADTSGLTPKQREALSLIESMSEEQLDSFLKLFNR